LWEVKRFDIKVRTLSLVLNNSALQPPLHLRPRPDKRKNGKPSLRDAVPVVAVILLEAQVPATRQ
jgi:hypothetical protein